MFVLKGGAGKPPTFHNIAGKTTYPNFLLKSVTFNKNSNALYSSNIYFEKAFLPNNVNTNNLKAINCFTKIKLSCI